MESKTNLSAKQAECLKMMQTASVVYLTNIDKDGFPSTRAMLNLKNPNEYPGLVAIHETEENPFTVFMTTNTSSQKEYWQGWIYRIKTNGSNKRIPCTIKKGFSILFLLLVLIQSSAWAQSDYQRIRISNDIELIKLSEKAYVHVSVSEMEGFGKVSSNGLALVNEREVFLFDTPVTDYQTEILVTWLTDSLKTHLSTFVPNHWHEDCLGGLQYLHSTGIKSYANQLTIELAKEHGKPVPQHGFIDSLQLNLNGLEAICYYLGGGHSADNIAVWIPSEKILFGGCMVKDIHSKGLGNLSDAKMEEWLPTIQKVIAKFPDAEIIIPGHRQIGGKELLEHTKILLLQYNKLN